MNKQLMERKKDIEWQLMQTLARSSMGCPWPAKGLCLELPVGC